MPDPGATCLLVGGGYGVAPLAYLADDLSRAGHRVDVVVGAASAARLHGERDAERYAASVTVTTEDATAGTPGRVTDVLDDVIDGTGADVVYACGPNAMLAAVTTVAARHDLACHVAVEELMACGVGVCWTCVLPLRDGHGYTRRRSCIDGPVFSGHAVDWERTRWTAP
jgi:dihydroorotate dehydrogenase electron transfer subunit